jgi:hypothetical protein
VLVVGNQSSGVTGEGAARTAVPANLAVFRVKADGTLEFVRRYDMAAGRKPLWWMGVVAIR